VARCCLFGLRVTGLGHPCLMREARSCAPREAGGRCRAPCLPFSAGVAKGPSAPFRLILLTTASAPPFCKGGWGDFRAGGAEIALGLSTEHWRSGVRPPTGRFPAPRPQDSDAAASRCSIGAYRVAGGAMVSEHRDGPPEYAPAAFSALAQGGAHGADVPVVGAAAAADHRESGKDRSQAGVLGAELDRVSTGRACARAAAAMPIASST
jgi:hypothetical protein